MQKIQKYISTNKNDKCIIKGGILGKMVGNINNLNISKNGKLTINSKSK